jgi:predicted ABC-type ATPase
MRPEFILVTGANGVGKTTLIENNRSLLEAADFKIIIPDDIFRRADSYTAAADTVTNQIFSAIEDKKNLVLESPFRSDTLNHTLDDLRKSGYSMTMYQLFVKNVEQSVIRVKDRFKKGGLYIDSSNVRDNYIANMNNVANEYYRFDHSYFIDTAEKGGRKLVAAFDKAVMVQYRPSSIDYLKELFRQSALNKKISKDYLKIIEDDRDYPRPLRKRSPRHRLKF